LEQDWLKEGLKFHIKLVKENKEKEREKKEEEKKEPEKKNEEKEPVKEKKEERVGIRTSGVVVELYSGAKVALYFNGRQHAGESVEELYRLRCPGLPPTVGARDHPIKCLRSARGCQIICVMFCRT
jgi:hypothetical protein